MMKYLLILALLTLLTGCFNGTYSKSQLEEALSYCKDNGGVKSIDLFSRARFYISCNDGALYRVTIKREILN